LDLAIESTSLLARDGEAPLVAQLAEDPRSEDALLCTHGETLAAVFRHWQRHDCVVLTPPTREIRKNMTEKSGGWLVEANTHLHASYFPPPHFPDTPTSPPTHG
jgi:hypothetical protein